MSPGEGRPIRALGLWTAMALVVGNMIGSGVFLLPASLAPYGGISILGWIFTTAGALVLALVFGRLSRAIPRAGGPYAYSRAGFGDFAGFLVAWGYWISIWCANAAIAVALVSYLSFFFPALAVHRGAAAVLALGSVWLLTAVNAAGVREAGRVQLVTTILKVLPLLAIGTLGFLYFDPVHYEPFNASGRSASGAIAATAALTLWAFLGFESATIPAEEVLDPERTIPRATVIGTIFAALVYILGTAAVMGIIEPARLAGSTAPFADAAREIWGGAAGAVVAAGAVISCFGALNGWILLSGRMPWAAARDGLFPAFFGRLSRRGTPTAGLVVSGVLLTILVGMNYTQGLVDQFTFILLLATLTALVPYALSAGAQLMLLAKGEVPPGSRRRTGTALLALVGFVYTLWAIWGAGRDIVYWGFLLLLAGVPVYVWVVWRSASRPDAAAGDGQPMRL